MCSICLAEDVELHLSCECKKSFCKECLANGITNALGNNKLFSCVCGEFFDESVVSGIVSKELAQKYSELSILLTLNNIYECGKCKELCDITDYEKQTYFCLHFFKRIRQK